ncbi:dephospho-CoA kinase [Desulfosediminicola ganghwensis]|uniref:dephospho-CoA kinase n=1 Tax=Desulfosediminicola ganghwensis TaxID=2569540 RepID=UPI0010AD8605|nr:dephospho-CoA kinase [Desulfosediminicola ganghwensis]
MNIALTGTVGSGKSVVAAMLSGWLQCRSIDTDAVSRLLLQPGQSAYLALQQRWGSRFISSSGDVDRAALRKAIFADTNLKKQLEALLHSDIRSYVTRQMEIEAAAGKHLLVEVPLLFEVGWQNDFDHTIAVYVPTALSVKRTMLRDTVSEAEAEAVVAAQISAEEKALMADSVINNSGVWGATVLQVSHLARNLQELGLE